jgi:hypothetical protein
MEQIRHSIVARTFLSAYTHISYSYRISNIFINSVPGSFSGTAVISYIWCALPGLIHWESVNRRMYTYIFLPSFHSDTTRILEKRYQPWNHRWWGLSAFSCQVVAEERRCKRLILKHVSLSLNLTLAVCINSFGSNLLSCTLAQYGPYFRIL